MRTSFNLLNRVIVIFKYLILSLAILFVLIVAGVNMPFVQRIITKKANEFFSRKELPVSVDRISLLIDGRVGLTRPVIIQNITDTIVYAGQIKISVKIIPLLFRKVKVKNITINDALVNLANDTITGKLNLISLFSKVEKAPETEQEQGKKWKIGINNVTLKNIRFTFTDIKKGTKVFQNITKLNLGIDRFSLTDKEIFVGNLDLEKVIGGIELKASSYKQETGDKSSADWKFKLKRGGLREIKFTLLQPQNKQRMEFSLSTGDISETGFELAGKRISVGSLSLEDPGILIFSSPAKTGKETGSEESSASDFPGPWKITSEKIKISNGFYHTKSYEDSAAATAKSILQIAALYATLKDLKISSLESGFTMNNLSIALDNGFRLDKGEISFSSDSTFHTKLYSNLKTEASRINLKLEAANDLSSLISSWRSVPFSLNIYDTEISSGDILSLFPQLTEKSTFKVQKNPKLGLNCNISGTAGLLNIKSFNAKTPSGNNLSLSGELINIINPKKAQINIEFLAGPVNAARLEEISQMTGSALHLPDFEPTTLRGKIWGTLIAQEFQFNIEGLSGNIAANGSVDMQDKSFSLKMNYKGIELGKLSGIKDMERISGDLNITGKEFSPYIMSLNGSITIDSAGFRGYNYHNINVELNGNNGNFNYGVNSGDPFFECNLTGAIGLNESSKRGTIAGTFGIDAGKLNIYRRFSLKGVVEAELSQSPGDIRSSIYLKNLIVSNDIKSEDLENLSLTFQTNDSLVTGTMKADFANADFHFAGSVDDLGSIFTKSHSRGLYLVDSTVSNRIPFVSVLPAIDLSVESTYDPFIGLFLSDTVFSYNRVSAKMVKDIAGITKADIKVDKFNIGTSSGFGATMHFESLPDSSLIMVKADSMRYGKISFAALEAGLSIENDTLLYRLKASSRNDSLLYDIEGAAFKNEKQIKLISTQPEWILNGFNWSVAPGVFLVLEPSKKDFIADMHWKNGDHTIDIYGRKSESLGLGLRKIWLNMLTIPGMNTFGYDAELTGRIDYQGNAGNELAIQMDIRQMKISEKILGNMRIDGSFISDSLGNIETDIRSIMNDTSRLDLTFRSTKKTGEKSFSSEFSAIPLNLLESFASKYVSGLEGEVSGDLELKSRGNKPTLDGAVKFKKTALTVVPLNARFYLNDDVIKLENNQMLFRGFTVQDSLKKQLIVNGGINLADPANITADLQISSDHLQVMNTTSKENPAFNGSVFIDSRLAISGPVQKPVISGNLILAEGTIVNYKLTENLNVSETEKTITFASLEEKGSVIRKSKINAISRSPNIEASIEINPSSLFSFEISRGYDIGITITGGGFLNYGVLPNGAISLSGTYEINQGNSILKIPGWPRKDFVITPGSYVKWNGPVDDPELNIETTSKVRGSYYNPVDGKNREVNFIVNMKIFNRLSQLEILFDVSSNDQYITSVFSTLSKDERMKQAINLLIFERVELPNMASSSDYVTQQINQFWESQINQLTKSAIKGVDLSFGIDTYTGAKEGGGEQTYTSFTYEVKKEMFNERGTVMVSGRMNDNSQAGAPTNNMLENFIFEYALDTNRTNYLKVYRQQNYEDLLEGEVIKSGVGYIYRKSYNRLSDIWLRNRKKVTENVNNGK